MPHRFARILLATAACCTVLVSSGLAQSREAGAARAHVAQLRDTAELRRLERVHAAELTADDHITAGFAALRMWEVTGARTHAGRSRRHFDRAVAVAPDNAWAHYGHALSFSPDIHAAAGVLVTDDVLGRALGFDAISRARRALERAIELDSSLPGAAELLLDYAVHTRDASALQLARTAFETAVAATDPPPPAALIGVARAAQEQADFAAAADAALRVPATAAEYAHAQLALTRALAATGRTADAGTAYIRAVAAAGDELLDELWSDARLIARDADEKRWAAAGDATRRRQLLRAFWDVRAALGAGTAEHRVGTHYARVSHAWINHRRHGAFGAPPLNALRWRPVEPRFTDTGVIYIRHGEPEYVFNPVSDYTVWFYRDELGRALSYHFVRHGGAAGWSKDHVLIRRLSCGLDPELAIRDTRLRPLVHGCSAREDVSAVIARDAERALGSDSDPPRFASALSFHFDLYTFRGRQGDTEVVAATAVPAEHAAVPLGITLVLVDTARQNVFRAAAGTPPLPQPWRAGDVLRSHLTLHVPPSGTTAYRLDVRNAAASAGATFGGPLDVPDYSGMHLMLSDILLAEQRDGGSYVRGDAALSLAPARSFAGGRLRVYYEIYNVEPGSTYHSEISVERADRGALARLLGRAGAVRLTFDDVAPPASAESPATVRVLRDVTASLMPGEYLLNIHIRSASGESATQQRRFTIPRQP